MASINYTPGGVVFEEFILENFNKTEKQDLTNFFVSIEIYESIFENVIYGAVTLADSGGLHQLFPVIGEETLTVRFRSDAESKEFSKVFRVYKMTDFTKATDTMMNYTLHFVSAEFVENEKLRIHRAFKNVLVEDIADDMFKLLGSDKKIDFDKTQNRQQIIVADMKPLQTINMMLSYAQSQTFPGSFYMFYENRDGFKFTTIDSLYMQKEVAQYEQLVKVQDLPVGKTAIYGYNDYTFTTKFDQLNSISRGMYQTSAIGVDLITKSFSKTSFNYSSDFEKLTHIEDGARLMSSSFVDTDSQQFKSINSRSLREKSQYFKSKNDTTYTFSKTLEDTLPQRISQFLQANFVTLNLNTYGNSDIKAGDIIKVILPSTAYKEKNRSELDAERYTGRYLIRDIKHKIVGLEYTQQVTCIRDILGATPKRDE